MNRDELKADILREADGAENAFDGAVALYMKCKEKDERIAQLEQALVTLAADYAKTKQDLKRARSRARTKATENRKTIAALKQRVSDLNRPWQLDLRGYRDSARLWVIDGEGHQASLTVLVDQYLTGNLDKLPYLKNALQEAIRTANGWAPIEPVKPAMPGQSYNDWSKKDLSAALDELHGPLQ